MTRVGMGEVRRDLDAIASSVPPEPRAAFVSSLEERLAGLIGAAGSGDVVPEIELAPAHAPRRAVLERAPLVLSITAIVLVVAASIVWPSKIERDIDAIRTAASSHNPSTTISTADLDGPPPADGGSDGATDSARPGRGVVPSGGDRSTAVITSPAAPTAVVPQPGDASAPAGVAAQRPSDTSSAPPSSLTLEGSGTPARMFLSWSRYQGDDFAAYLVLRANAPDEPDHPDTSGRTLMLLRIENRDMTSHADTPKVGTTPRYRVVVVRSDGSVAARSNVVEGSAVATGMARLGPRP
ncbi:MAG TPA: hypothetical protein VM345_18995 [Acidimicrobiales bacterium]|nr:hypothetical protein [Acidimicrobiales bacterium]